MSSSLCSLEIYKTDFNCAPARIPKQMSLMKLAMVTNIGFNFIAISMNTYWMLYNVHLIGIDKREGGGESG